MNTFYPFSIVDSAPLPSLFPQYNPSVQESRAIGYHCMRMFHNSELLIHMARHGM